jgi:putative nucleotidyltransferase with HDIG domain
VLLLVGVVALVLAGAASWWLARTLARPIDQLTLSLSRMAETRDLHEPLPRSGVSREIDALAETFDTLRSAVSEAEAESDAAYLGVIGALAAALDARDPYTAGHSQRVADLSVVLARHMNLSDQDRETLRLGALLHDIGKIGISDAVLRKPAKLTDDEFDHIKLHPVLGARILQPLKFLAPHLPVVELHHERPDGRGYPHGLRGDAIPLFARIVHVADAFDAMTSARAYRPGRPAAEAMAELWRCVDTDFDARVVQAMAAVWDTELVRSAGDTQARTGHGRATASPAAPFRLRVASRVPQGSV